MTTEAELEQLAAYWEARPHRSGINLDTMEADLAEMERRREATQQVAEVDGKHYSAYASRIKALQQAGKYEDALELCDRCIAASRRESRVLGGDGMEAKAYPERKAMILRKLKRHDEERELLEDYVSRYPKDGTPNKIHARLEKLS